MSMDTLLKHPEYHPNFMKNINEKRAKEKSK
jgi:hypothetical protein